MQLLGRQHTWCAHSRMLDSLQHPMPRPSLCALRSSISGKPRPTHALRKRRATTAQIQDGKVVDGRPFFDREAEQAKLLDQLRETPDNMLLVLGPLSSGKTRLLREVLLSGKLDTPVSWFSGRDQKLSDANVMAEALSRELLAQLNALEKIGQGVMDGAKQFFQTKLGIDIKLLEGNETIKLLPAPLAASAAPTSSAVNRLIGGFEALLDKRSEASGSPPVICIDEVNVLMDWFEGDTELQTDLDALLRFFVKITKERPQAHVILATSDYSFLTWLKKKVKVGFFITEVIGDFPEPQACKYFQGLMSNKREVTDKEWTSVFEVCGGNAGILTTTARLIRSYGKVQEALKVIWREPFDAVKSGFAEDCPWKTEQYRTMLRLICESDHAAVTVTDAHRELKSGGQQAVQAMVKADLLAYRPASTWARDIPIEAFGPEQEAVLTAPSATHLYCMRRLQRRGALESAAEAASSTPTAVQELSPDRWQQELEYLREDQKQLREENRQLREMLRQLREE